MLTRSDFESRERQFLSSFAALSAESRGRVHFEESCETRTAFQRDRDRIIHSKAFRRLKHKTQVFISPEGDHYRTRLTHTLEVAGIARTIARGLALNEDLTEAIALGHDLGHTPFGHAGEEVLNRLYPGGFHHRMQSLRVVDYLEVRAGKNMRGLNLTYEVRDGILNHTGETLPITLEGQIVRLADRIAYINHDIDDSVRAGLIEFEDLPQHLLGVLGESHSGRIDMLVKDIIKTSWNCPEIAQSPKIREALNELRDWMFANVYRTINPAKVEEIKAMQMLENIYHYYIQHADELPPEYRLLDDELNRKVVDYIAGMSDRYALALAHDIFFPKPWLGKKEEDW